MATTTDAIARLASSTGWPERRVAQIAKALRESGDDLWPTGGLGGGKRAAHVEAHHLRNLLIACLGAEFVQDAPKTVRTFAALKGRDAVGSTWRDRRDLQLLASLFPARSRITFGAAIDRLIEAHMDPERNPKLLEMVMQIEVMRETGSAQIIVDDPTRTVIAHFTGDASDVIRTRLGLRWAAYLHAGVRAGICADFAALVADTRWRKQQ